MYTIYKDGHTHNLASLGGADLSRADLSGANLSGANLTRADLTEANGIVAFINIAEWGPLYVCSNRWVKIGCRWFTKDEALAHWKDRDDRPKTRSLLQYCIDSGILL